MRAPSWKLVRVRVPTLVLPTLAPLRYPEQVCYATARGRVDGRPRYQCVDITRGGSSNNLSTFLTMSRLGGLQGGSGVTQHVNSISITRHS